VIGENKKSMWEILVPTIKNDGEPFETQYHKIWDECVRKITNGLTIFSPAKGQWISPAGDLFFEKMIPTRILATREEIEKIVDMTLEHYNQKAVLAYKLGDDYILKYAPKEFCPVDLDVAKNI